MRVCLETALLLLVNRKGIAFITLLVKNYQVAYMQRRSPHLGSNLKWLCGRVALPLSHPPIDSTHLRWWSRDTSASWSNSLSLHSCKQGNDPNIHHLIHLQMLTYVFHTLLYTNRRDVSPHNRHREHSPVVMEPLVVDTVWRWRR